MKNDGPPRAPPVYAYVVHMAGTVDVTSKQAAIACGECSGVTMVSQNSKSNIAHFLQVENQPGGRWRRSCGWELSGKRADSLVCMVGELGNVGGWNGHGTNCITLKPFH